MAAGPCDLSTSSALPLRKAWVPHSAARGSASAIAASFNSDSESAYVRPGKTSAPARDPLRCSTQTPQRRRPWRSHTHFRHSCSGSLRHFRRARVMHAPLLPACGPRPSGARARAPTPRALDSRGCLLECRHRRVAVAIQADDLRPEPQAELPGARRALPGRNRAPSPRHARACLATRKESATSSRPVSRRTQAASSRVCSALALARYRRTARSSHFCAPFVMPHVAPSTPTGARRRRSTDRILEAYWDNVAADRHTVISTSSAGSLGGQGSTPAALRARTADTRAAGGAIAPTLIAGPAAQSPARH